MSGSRTRVIFYTVAAVISLAGLADATELARHVSRTTDAYPYEDITLKHIERTAYVRAGPECFVAKIGNSLGR